MKILIKGATEQIVRKRDVRQVLSRIDVRKGDLIHKFDVYLTADYGISLDTIHFIDGIRDYIDIRIYSSTHQLVVSIQLSTEDVLGVEVVIE